MPDRDDALFSAAVLIIMLSLLSFFLIGEFLLQPSISLGSSMEPNLHEGEMAFWFRNFNADNIPVGSIISYRYNNTFSVSHRVVRIGSDDKGIFYICRGDNNTVEDPSLIRTDRITGVLAFTQPFYLLPLELLAPVSSFLCSVTVLRRIKKSKGGEKKNEVKQV